MLEKTAVKLRQKVNVAKIMIKLEEGRSKGRKRIATVVSHRKKVD